MFTRLRICIGMTAAATIALVLHFIFLERIPTGTVVGLTLCVIVFWALYFIDRRKGSDK